MTAKTKQIVETGMTIGNLTILSKSSPAHWICRCICGKDIRIPNWKFNTGYKLSCGCQQGVHSGGRIWHDPADSYRHKQHVTNARKRNRIDKLSKDDFAKLIHQPCHYHGGNNDALGIDRVDNGIGYTKENCVPCCWKCNKMKGTMEYHDFKTQIALISQNSLCHLKTSP